MSQNGQVMERRERAASRESLFDELLDSGDEIERHEPRRRRVGLQHYAFLDGSTQMLDVDDSLVLPEQIVAYNRKRSREHHLLLSEDHIYSGLLRFQYQSGRELVQEDVHVHSSTTSAELVPELLLRFLPHLPPDHGTGSTCIALVQGEMDRELDMDEKPLEIALDCSIRGLASPKFILKITPPSPGQHSPHHTRRFSSQAGSSSLSNSLGSGVQALGVHFSPHHKQKSAKDLDGLSVNSIGSVHSSTSSKSNKSLLQRSTNSLAKGKKHMLSNNDVASSSPRASPDHLAPALTPTSPSNTRKFSLSSPKSVMSHFITRSLRMRRKSKKSRSGSEDEVLHGEELNSGVEVSSLVSPVPSERRFVMSTVMHVYFTDARKTQVYKSVLVSEKATTIEVIKLALERYNMKYCDPLDFCLFEVIGQWQDITQAVTRTRRQSELTASNSSTVPASAYSPMANRRPPIAVEEFVTLYAREFRPNETPYSAQFYLVTQEGYSRRFELRWKTTQEDEEREGVDGEHDQVLLKASRHHQLGLGFPSENNLCIFGDTVHRKRRSRARTFQLTQQSLDSADSTASLILQGDISVLQEDDTAQDEDLLRVEGGTEEATEVEKRTLQRTANDDVPTALIPVQQPDFQTHTCNSPDSGVAFNKDQQGSTKSSVSSEQQESLGAGIHPANVGSAFLLSLRLHNPEKELLIQKLQATRTLLLTHDTNSQPSATKSATTQQPSEEVERIYLHMPADDEPSPVQICCIHRKIQDGSSRRENGFRHLEDDHPHRFEYAIEVLDTSSSVCINGQTINSSTTLQHGDLLAVGSCHLFMFQDYSSGPNIDFNWRPFPLHPSRASLANKSDGNFVSIPTHGVAQEREENVPYSAAERVLLAESPENDCISRDSSPIDVGPRMIIRQSSPAKSGSLSSSLSEIPILISDCLDSAVMLPEIRVTDSLTTFDVFQPDSRPQNSTPVFSSARSNVSRRLRTSSSGMAKDRKMIFSFSVAEEDTLLDYIVMRQDPSRSQCKLAPSYVLSMCVEFSTKCNGSLAAARFVRKAADCIHDVIWEYTRKVAEWRPDPSIAHQPMSLITDVFSVLTPVCFWFANALEFYHHVSEASESLDFSSLAVLEAGGSPHKTGEHEEDPLCTMHGAMVYAFQQSFYLIIKALNHSLSVVLESCTEVRLLQAGNGRNIVIDQAVEFLQALLDLLTEHNLHLEVVSQLFANIFFFISISMFNSLVDQGSHLGLFQHSSGVALRANLDLLEGWACQVGFKDVVLQYLAKVSSVVDLLAMPPRELIHMSWSSMLTEYPVLHPAQLHFVLSQYLLPTSMEFFPTQWTPPEKDALTALNAAAVRETFHNHPGFEVPTSGFLVDLSQPPSEADEFQAVVETLREALKNPKGRSVDVVPVEDAICPQSSFPFVLTEGEQSGGLSSHLKGHKTSILVRSWERLVESSTPTNAQDIGSNTESQEDLLEDKRNRRNVKRQELEQSSDSLTPVVTDSPENSGTRQFIAIVDGVGKGRVERVRSLVGPKSCKTPEKLVLEADISQTQGEGCTDWMAEHFPPGARTVNLQRGNHGFGFTIVEGKDSSGDNRSILIQRVLPDTQADKLKKVMPGDRILAIDGQIMDGADYLIAEKYLKAAEEEVSLVVSPQSRYVAT